MTPKTDFQNTPACLKNALFFHAMPAALFILAPLFFGIASTVLTICIRSITPGVGDQPKALPTGETASVDVERTAIPENIPTIIEPTIEGDATDDQPPPYEHPSPTPPIISAGFQAPATPALPAPIGVPQGQLYRVLYNFTKNGAFEMTVKENDLVTVTHKENKGWWFAKIATTEGWVPTAYLQEVGPAALCDSTIAPSAPITMSKRSSAHLFVLGTSVFIPLLASVFCFALSLQHIIHCNNQSPMGPLGQSIIWIAFSIPTLFASTGVTCWFMLLRDLWGPRATQRFPIDSGLVPISLIVIVGAVTVGPFIVVGQGAIWAVEKCQGRFCGDAIEADNERENGMELEEGQRLVGGDGENGEEASGTGEEIGIFAKISDAIERGKRDGTRRH